MIEIVPETPALHAEAIEDLFDRTFGPGHFAKTAERLRENSASLPEINRVAVDEGKVVGVCRVWPLVVGEGRRPALFYGPVAVDPAYRGNFLSLRITEAALEAGKQAGWPAAVLIGAHSLFGKAGFTVTPKNKLTFPGPQDQSRVMVRDLAGDASLLEGRVTSA
ncbi:MAG: N-acetyltransferase [Hyphomonas sp.]|uniref:GNAT family N-acetyltransferase n=1 Tax=Hyphomonas sp. TaxID=87 RepID=UPI0018287B90|nr:N-acetyltransferase [Hyphomonas sp.]MBU3919285.1 N-acetyltransferase [Alphaproteobacteria bacterium]MBA3068488.1 N-acetyltransferase [Hyphomonas sp.]MBU4060645.1 N-acetyltransferase [Alphaproteobacteria bacterium]MBU4164629.1 N-acetyltransferase [Alphaproteobacteria bacterium]MBU4567675.1 N-acetyltransferase [Alphaproteobacteria bacterium]